MATTLMELKKGQAARITGFENGYILRLRLENMGIREGKTIQRLSAQIMGGPIIVSVDGRQTAMGRNMASKIKVEINEPE